MQFLIKEGILVIPEEQTQIDPPSLPLDTGLGDDTIETTTSISIKMDDYSYDEGDTIVISGNVEAKIGETLLIIQLFAEDKSLIDVAQITVAQDGTFTKTFLAEGALWKHAGEYLVRASYQDQMAETKFSFIPKAELVETTSIFEVSVASHGTFDVEYSIKGGTIRDMMLDYNVFGLVTQIESTDEGTITLDLPRELIGSEKQDGKEDTFTILIDGIEVAYRESVVHSDFRTITVNFEEGDAEIKIIGSYLIGNNPDSTITVQTDKAQAYRNGDMVKITGEFTNVDEPSKVSVMVYDSEGVFIIEPRMFANTDGFSTTIDVDDSINGEFRKYLIKVFYNEKLKAETTFWYDPN